MASQGGKRRTKRLLLAFIVTIGKSSQDGVAQRFMLASHEPKLCHPQESLRTSINPKYACPCVQKSTRQQHPQQPTRDHWVFENMISECISRTKATLSRIPGYEYAGTLASVDGRGLSGHTVRRFMSKLFSSAGLEDEVVAWFIGHGCRGTGAWHVGDTLNPGGNDNLVTRTCILELYQRFVLWKALDNRV